MKWVWLFRRWCCSAHTGNEESSCVGGVAERSCVHFGVVESFCGTVYGLPVDFRWPVNTWLEMVVLEAQNDAVVGVVRVFPFGHYEHPAFAATPPVT